jgi:hypothetical protein
MSPSKKIVSLMVMLLVANVLLGLTCFFGEWALSPPIIIIKYEATW